MFTCVYCDKNFKYQSEKKRHEKSHVPQFECSDCSKKFSFVSALRRHQKQHQRTGSVVCSECSRSFRDEILLKRHKKYAHNETHVCEKCQAKFNSLQALHSHQKSHKPKSERRYHCGHSGCLKTFNFIHHLKHHELTHSAEKQHYCNLCGKGFIQLHHLKTHLRNHQPETWLKCTIHNCDKFFATEYALKRHLATHRDTVSDAESDKKYSDEHRQMKEDLFEDHQQIENKKFDNQEQIYDDWLEDYHTTLEQDLSIKGNNVDHKSIVQVPSNLNCDIDNKVLDDPPKDNVVIDKSIDKSKCQSCACSGTKNVTLNKNLPELKFNTDGTIKLKEFIDTDIEIFSSKLEDSKVDNKKELSSNLLPYNSCKAVLGRCIVSGSETINEECLCARMTIDDNQIYQEIEEITPHPVN